MAEIPKESDFATEAFKILYEKWNSLLKNMLFD